MEPLLTIGTFGRAVGLPPSALRHYAAEGILVPTEVDASSGYRYYSPDQLRSGELVRRMRAAEVPLPLMQQVLSASPAEAARLLEDFGRSLDHQLTRRRAVLGAAVDTVQQSVHPVRTLTVPGPVLAAALGQALIAATRDETDDVSGVTWDAGEGQLRLIATDRYWLVHRRLLSRVDGPRVRAITSAVQTERAARLVSRCGQVQLQVGPAGVTLHDADGSGLVELAAVRRDVPDLELLVTSRPPAGTVLGFDRAELLRALAALPPAEPTPIHLHADRAVLGDRYPPLSGWATSQSSRPSATVLVRPALLSAATRVCPGAELLIWVPDDHAPLVLSSVDQDSLTVLVMPMRA